MFRARERLRRTRVRIILFLQTHRAAGSVWSSSIQHARGYAAEERRHLLLPKAGLDAPLKHECRGVIGQALVQGTDGVQNVHRLAICDRGQTAADVIAIAIGCAALPIRHRECTRRCFMELRASESVSIESSTGFVWCQGVVKSAGIALSVCSRTTAQPQHGAQRS